MGKEFRQDTIKAAYHLCCTMSGNFSQEDSMAGSSNNLQTSLLLRLAFVPDYWSQRFYMIIYSFKATVPMDGEDAASPFDLTLKVTYITLYLLKQL